MVNEKDSSLFYNGFRDAIICSGLQPVEECDKRIKYIEHNYTMIPKKHEELIFSLTRSYPTPPTYAFLVIGVLGTNIARYCGIARPGCHTDLSERSGAFYHFIAESRLGKGIALNLLWKLGSHVQKKRVSDFHALDDAPQNQPKRVFLPGGNSIQIHAEAAKNNGCGIIYVPEIKTGKNKYTDPEGTYGPLLAFYDDHVPGITFRKAEDIGDIDDCRLQVVAAGVTDDWEDFIKRSGPKSGTLARIIPVIGWDREVIRITQQNLPSFT